jgi:hypothetical protein
LQIFADYCLVSLITSKGVLEREYEFDGDFRGIEEIAYYDKTTDEIVLISGMILKPR